LFHGLVDGHLIFDLHLIELVDAADSVIGQHQRSCLDTHISILVSSYTGSETGRTGGLSVSVHTSRHEFIDAFEELGLG
jgi:hypothetical protein